MMTGDHLQKLTNKKTSLEALQNNDYVGHHRYQDDNDDNDNDDYDNDEDDNDDNDNDDKNDDSDDDTRGREANNDDDMNTT